MNRYITNDLSKNFQVPQPSYCEMKKQKDLRIGDYINIPKGFIGCYACEYLGVEMNKYGETYMKIKYENSNDTIDLVYEPESLIACIHPKFNIGDTIRCGNNRILIHYIIASDDRYFIYEAKGNSILKSFNSNQKLRIYKYRDMTIIERLLKRIDYLEARVTKLENQNK
jgi:hypothetical protein